MQKQTDPLYTYRIYSAADNLVDIVDDQIEAFSYFLHNTEHIATGRVEQFYDGKLHQVYDSVAIANYCRPILMQRQQRDLFE